MAVLERAFDGIDLASLLPLLFFSLFVFVVVSAWYEEDETATKGLLPINPNNRSLLRSIDRAKEYASATVEKSPSRMLDASKDW